MSSISAIYDAWRSCDRCRLSCGRTGCVVVGAGAVPAPLLVIVDAPTAEDARTGMPLSGPEGAWLLAEFTRMQIDPHWCAIAPLVACRPPEGRAPLYDEVEVCRERLDAVARLVKPYAALLLGRTALTAVTGETELTKKQGRWLEVLAPKALLGIPALAAFHPIALMSSRRSPGVTDLEAFRAALEVLAAYLKESVRVGGREDVRQET